MGDFGAVISVTKGKGLTSSSSPFQQGEINDLSEKLKALIDSDDNYINFLGDPYKSDFSALDDSLSELRVHLSEYYYGEDEEEDEDLFDGITDEELQDAEELADKLSKAFPAYSFTGKVIEFED